MTGEELAALIRAEIERDSRLQTIRQRIRDGKADFSDSERYAEIEAEITGRVMRNNVLTLEDRQASYVAATRERHKDIFGVFSEVQEQKDAKDGVRIKPQEPPFEEKRAGKIGHALEDKTVPDKTIQRRAESATETFIRSQHDDCMKYNAEFRDRAGMTSYIIRDGSAKCCDWCADVSGKFTLDSAPAGIWGRHDNCKCSIQYDAKKGGRQLLRGTSKKWEKVAPGAGAGELVVLTEEQAAAAGAGAVHRMTKERAEDIGASPLVRHQNTEEMAAGKKEMIDVPPIKHSTEEKLGLAQYAGSLGFKFENAMQFDGNIELLKEQLDIMAKLRDEFKIPRRIVLQVANLGEDCGETVGRRTIRINSSAMRSDTATSAYFNADNKLSSSRAIGIGVHEIGHLIAKKYGEIGLDIARKACYNVSGTEFSYVQTLDYLLGNVSEYSITKNPKAISNKFKPTHYHEVIPEILGKHFTNPDEFTTEFYRLLKEACQI